jgi:hypothetical protein
MTDCCQGDALKWIHRNSKLFTGLLHYQYQHYFYAVAMLLNLRHHLLFVTMNALVLHRTPVTGTRFYSLHSREQCVFNGWRHYIS